VLTLDGSAPPRPFLATHFVETNARFSPDGRWVAYVSDESGNREIYVRPFPGLGGKWQVSNAQGRAPHWAADGRRVLFLDPEGGVQEASVSPDGPALRIGRPELVAKLPGIFADSWDLTDDARRLLFAQDPVAVSGGTPNQAAAPNLVRFTFHWFEDLRRQLGAGTGS
jgi:dipeptidyl aminopeptidase/acylaminoacyl peptidase